MDGLEPCAVLCRGKVGQSIYSIPITGDGDESILVDAFDRGVDDFVAKPLSPKVLQARLKAAGRMIAVESQVRISPAPAGGGRIGRREPPTRIRFADRLFDRVAQSPILYAADGATLGGRRVMRPTARLPADRRRSFQGDQRPLRSCGRRPGFEGVGRDVAAEQEDTKTSFVATAARSSPFFCPSRTRKSPSW